MRIFFSERCLIAADSVNRAAKKNFVKSENTKEGDFICPFSGAQKGRWEYSAFGMNDESVKALESMGMGRLILKFSAPAIIATVVSATYNVVDRIFVGRVCGEDALAAITVCFPPALFLLAIAMTVGQGSATLLSIKLGERDREGAEKVLGQAVFLFFAFYACAATLALLFMDELLTFFGATERILPLAASYYSIIIGGLIFEKISFGVNNLIRAEGRPTYSMSTIVIGGCANVFLDWLFMCRFGWGIRGAAFATIAAQACGSLWVLYFYLGGKSYVKLRLKNLRAHWNLALSMLYAGSPSLIIQGLSSAATMMFVRQARVYGSESAIAVIGIAMTVTTFIFLPVVGLSMGVQPIIGFNRGAGNYVRVKSAFANALRIGTSICAAGFLAAQIFPDAIFSIFLPSDSPLIATGEGALRLLTLCFPFVAANIVASGYFQSVKKPAMSIMITVVRQVLFLVPCLYLLPRFMGLNGIWASFAASDFMAFLFSAAIVWREMRVLNSRIGGKCANVG